MTLILSAVTRHYAHQASDRLVSTDLGGVYSDFDAMANKTVVIASTDCLVSISYTGVAYVRDVTMDRWLAQTVLGEDLSDGMLRLGLRQLPPLYWIIRRIEEGIEAWAAGRLRSGYLQVIVTGLRVRRGRVDPLIWTITHDKNSKVVVLDRSLSRWPPIATFMMGRSGGGTSATDQAARAAIARSQGEPSAVRGGMIDAIQFSSQHLQAVGSAAIGVTLSYSLTEAVLVVEYAPSHVGTPDLVAGDALPPRAYTPWIITSGSVQAPSLVDFRDTNNDGALLADSSRAPNLRYHLRSRRTETQSPPPVAFSQKRQPRPAAPR